ncbi:protein sidekick-2-like [Limulus polyphemus]|uniref:Protein sidekick-2-like n=1 Tax=Limulus polyphemus TaxID=6850 RepID=A0ABM1B3Y1_LIMPO|nr:protein sidekick-2-like [Limulus polyphemus]XP_013774330.1 protein sidekick-2-like [Limulus polyphemus]XP_013774331.1 protein sidekick-2-like [Limulus polyphemus]XP_013774332.1 protein sidekick-2-like [Limulus polyphemus]
MKQEFVINHYKYVLPNSPWSLRSTEKTPNSIKLEWLHPKNFEYWKFEPGLYYELSYRPKFLEDQEWKIVSIGIGKQMYNVTGLIPNTDYELSVRCRSAEADQEDMWSKPARTSEHTDPDVPYYVPNITKGTFEVQKFINSRTITLYWKPVPPEHYNGEDFRYVISYKQSYSMLEKREVSGKIVEVTGMKHTFTDMDHHTVYHFKIQSANKEGLSSNMVEMTVDKTQKLLPGPEEVTALSYGNGKYRVMWEYPKKNISAISGFTVFWCPSLHLRKHPVEWQFVPANMTYEDIQLPYDTSYQFAVSADTRKTSSGMKWASCIVPYGNTLDKVQDVRLSSGVKHLKVEWRLLCSAQKKVVVKYKVDYCEVETRQEACKQNLWNVTVDNQEATEIQINGLKPFTLYRVTIQVFSKGGISDLSEPEFERTKSGAPSAPWDVKILDINATAMYLTWKAPLEPNGIISHYVVHYKNNSQKVFVNKDEGSPSVILWKNIESYTNYSVVVEACVDRYCSPPSEIIHGMTLIDAPGVMEEPHIEVINSTAVRIKWSPPDHPNGPVNFYLLNLKWQYRENGSRSEFINVPGCKTSVVIPLNCSTQLHSPTISFSIQAVNLKNNTNLLGPTSPSTQTKMCFTDGLQTALIIGTALGGIIGLVVLVVILYSLVCWMTKKINLMKQTKVQLPNGLDAPTTGYFTGFSNMKQHKDRKNSDAIMNWNLPIERLHLFLSNNNNINSFNERHRSENSHYSSSSTNELIQRKVWSTNIGRNPSGDSSGYGSTGGHDSISSSLTNRTHLSSESNTEFHLTGPDTPDTVFMDCNILGSDHFIYSQTKLEMDDFQNSADNKEETNPLNQVADVSDSQPLHQDDKHHNTQPLFTNNLSNSEPSVFDIDGEGADVSTKDQTLAPYSRFGLAKSICLSLNSSALQEQPENMTPNAGYSKFGVFHILRSSSEHSPKGNGSNFTAAPQFSIEKMPTKGYVLTKPVFESSLITSIKPTHIATTNSLPYKDAYSKLSLASQLPKSGEYVSLPNAVRMFRTFNDTEDNHNYSKFSIDLNLQYVESLEEGKQESLPPEPSNVTLKNSNCDNLDVAVISGASSDARELTSTMT